MDLLMLFAMSLVLAVIIYLAIGFATKGFKIIKRQ